MLFRADNVLSVYLAISNFKINPKNRVAFTSIDTLIAFHPFEIIKQMFDVFIFSHTALICLVKRNLCFSHKLFYHSKTDLHATAHTNSHITRS